jgi:hypothetical protein
LLGKETATHSHGVILEKDEYTSATDVVRQLLSATTAVRQLESATAAVRQLEL